MEGNGGLTVDSLEKSMFFIPNRLFVQDNEMYVSFNIAGIPSDMEVTSMILYVPLPEVSSEVRLDLHEIVAAWDEQSVTHVRPVYTQARSKGYFCSETKEGSFALEHLAHPWRSHSLENHGVYVRVHSLDPVLLSEEHPPYLIVKTV